MSALATFAEDNGITVVQGTGQSTLDETDRAEIGRLLCSAGALWFKGFRIDGPGFAETALAFCDGFHLDPNRDEIAGLPPYIRSITKGVAAEQLHSELTSTQHRPEIIWFYCAVPAEVGGETRLCDGAKVWDCLGAQAKGFFEGRRVIYHRRNRIISGEEAEQWRDVSAGASKVILRSVDGDRYELAWAVPTINVGLDGRPAFANGLITDSYERCAVVLEDGSRLPVAFWEEAVRAARSVQTKARLESGQFLMLDNLRFMHGRTPVHRIYNRVFYAAVADKLRDQYRLP